MSLYGLDLWKQSLKSHYQEVFSDILNRRMHFNTKKCTVFSSFLIKRKGEPYDTEWTKGYSGA